MYGISLGFSVLFFLFPSALKVKLKKKEKIRRIKRREKSAQVVLLLKFMNFAEPFYKGCLMRSHCILYTTVALSVLT